MAKKDDSILMYRIAKLYYLQNISQVEISRIEGISRSTVSRLLDKARSSGIISVDVKLPISTKAEKLEKELCKRLGIKEVIVAPTSAQENTPETEEAILRDLSSVAAAHLPRLLADCQMIGIGWGRSLYHTAAELPYTQATPAKLFVPIVNDFSTHVRYLQTSTIVSRFSEKFESNGYYLNIAPKQRIKGERTEEELNNIRQLAVYWDVLDAAILSFSSPQQCLSSPIYRCLWENGLDTVPPEEEHMLFECMGQVLYEDGSYYGVNRNYDTVALDLQRLKEIPNVICIGGGIAKVQTLVYAGLSGYYKTLIVDHPTAENMLRTLRARPRTAKKA